MSKTPLFVEIRRGPVFESYHLVQALVQDADGKIIESFGNIEEKIYPRSSIKMLQALHFVETGAVEKFGLSEENIAIACSSHRGEPVHTKVVEKWLNQIGLDENYLDCGAHEPYDEISKYEMIRTQTSPRKVHNNCSGKHCGMLSTVKLLGMDLTKYSLYDHPLQKKLRDFLAELSGVDYQFALWGIDGCGIPTYSVPLSSISKAMLIFLESNTRSELIHQSSKRILSALQKHPVLFSGSSGLGTTLIEVTKGRIFAKVGAEGVYSVVIPSLGLAITLKVADGAGRASDAAILFLLRRHNAISDEELEEVYKRHPLELKNWAGEVVGQIKVRDPDIIKI